MAAPADSRGLGIPRSAGDDHGAEVYVSLSREALQLRVSGLPKSGRSGGALEIVATGRNRGATDGRIHDGSGSKRERAGVPSSGLHVFFWRGRCRITCMLVIPDGAVGVHRIAGGTVGYERSLVTQAGPEYATAAA